VLVYFWASWCGPCQLMAPIVNSIAQVYGDRLKIVKMEVDPNPIAAKQYKVEGVPALRLFKDGKEIASQEGIEAKNAKQKINEWLKAHL